MDRQRLIDDLHISLENLPDAIERLFCGAVLGAGVDNAAKVLKTYNEWKDMLGIKTAAPAPVEPAGEGNLLRRFIDCKYYEKKTLQICHENKGATCYRKRFPSNKDK